MTDRLRSLSQADQEKILNTKQATMAAYYREFFGDEAALLIKCLPPENFQEYINILITKTDHGLLLDGASKKEIDTINYLFLHIARNDRQPKS